MTDRGLTYGRRAVTLGAMGALAGCVAQPAPGFQGPAGASLGPAPRGARVSVLLPLSGPLGETGRSLLHAAHLALDPPGGPAMDERDTKGTPEGAAAAARAALDGGAGIVVGPLTAAETEAVARVMGPAHVPVLAFTSDAREARPGVWVFGITPGQQVRTLVRAAAADRRTRLAALLPRNPFGDALADGLAAAPGGALGAAQVIRTDSGSGALAAAVDQLAGQGGTLPDALLLGATVEESVGALPALRRANLGPDRVRLLGTALWARPAPSRGQLAGAWFAGPDERALRVFEQNFTAKFGTPPKPFDSIGFDTAATARVAAGPGGVDPARLLTPMGFAGANGTFTLLPDGGVRRALALFEVGPNGLIPRGIPPDGPAA